VLALHRVDAVRQRLRVVPLVETPGRGQILGLARDRVEVRQDLVHAALLGEVEDPLHVSPVGPVGPRLDPTGHSLDDLERPPAAAVLDHVDETGHDLVDRVVRRPDAPDRFDAVEEGLREGADVSRRA
jgi:hypothetical protein